MSDYLFVNGELYHFGVKGMKWGRRRYQNPDGSLTPAGKKRLAKQEYRKANKDALNRFVSEGNKLKAKGLENDVEAVTALSKKYDDDRAKNKAIYKQQKQKANDTRDADERAKRKNDLKNRRVMSDKDLEGKINRLKMERQFKQLVEEDIKPGRTAVKKFMGSVGGKVLTSAAVGALAYAGKYAVDRNLDLSALAGYMFPNPNKKK